MAPAHAFELHLLGFPEFLEIHNYEELKDQSVVVIVALEDIMMYITIVYFCTPIEDVFPSFWDVIIMYGHIGKPSVVSRGNSPHVK